jgi:hypothetical protein
MEKDSCSAWNIPQPTLRLVLIFLLGFLGMFLFPGKNEFFPNVFVEVHSTTLGLWLVVAFIAILLLYFMERSNADTVPLTQTRTGIHRWLVYRLLLAFISPLLIAAARPSGDDETSWTRKLSKMGFLIFPYVVAVGFSLFICASVGKISHVAMKFCPFSLWAYLACFLLFLLSPWPKYPQMPQLRGLPDSRKFSPLGTFFLMALVVAPFVLFAYVPVLNIINGKISTIEPRHDLGALDGPGTLKCIFLFIYFSMLLLPYMLSVTWLSRRTWSACVALGLPFGILAMGLFSLLIWAVRYLPDGRPYEMP